LGETASKFNAEAAKIRARYGAAARILIFDEDVLPPATVADVARGKGIPVRDARDLRKFASQIKPYYYGLMAELQAMRAKGQLQELTKNMGYDQDFSEKRYELYAAIPNATVQEEIVPFDVWLDFVESTFDSAQLLEAHIDKERNRIAQDFYGAYREAARRYWDFQRKRDEAMAKLMAVKAGQLKPHALLMERGYDHAVFEAVWKGLGADVAMEDTSAQHPGRIAVIKKILDSKPVSNEDLLKLYVDDDVSQMFYLGLNYRPDSGEKQVLDAVLQSVRNRIWTMTEGNLENLAVGGTVYKSQFNDLNGPLVNLWKNSFSAAQAFQAAAVRPQSDPQEIKAAHARFLGAYAAYWDQRIQYYPGWFSKLQETGLLSPEQWRQLDPLLQRTAGETKKQVMDQNTLERTLFLIQRGQNQFFNSLMRSESRSEMRMNYYPAGMIDGRPMIYGLRDLKILGTQEARPLSDPQTVPISFEVTLNGTYPSFPAMQDALRGFVRHSLMDSDGKVRPYVDSNGHASDWSFLPTDLPLTLTASELIPGEERPTYKVTAAFTIPAGIKAVDFNVYLKTGHSGEEWFQVSDHGPNHLSYTRSETRLQKVEKIPLGWEAKLEMAKSAATVLFRISMLLLTAKLYLQLQRTASDPGLLEKIPTWLYIGSIVLGYGGAVVLKLLIDRYASQRRANNVTSLPGYPKKIKKGGDEASSRSEMRESMSFNYRLMPNIPGITAGYLLGIPDETAWNAFVSRLSPQVTIQIDTPMARLLQVGDDFVIAFEANVDGDVMDVVWNLGSPSASGVVKEHLESIGFRQARQDNFFEITSAASVDVGGEEVTISFPPLASAPGFSGGMVAGAESRREARLQASRSEARDATMPVSDGAWEQSLGEFAAYLRAQNRFQDMVALALDFIRQRKQTKGDQDRLILSLASGSTKFEAEVARRNASYRVIATDLYPAGSKYGYTSNFNLRKLEGQELAQKQKEKKNITVLRGGIENVLRYVPESSLDDIVMIHPENAGVDELLKVLNSGELEKKLRPGGRIIIRPTYREASNAILKQPERYKFSWTKDLTLLSVDIVKFTEFQSRQPVFIWTKNSRSEARTAQSVDKATGQIQFKLFSKLSPEKRSDPAFQKLLNMYWPEESRQHYDMRRDWGVDGLIVYSGEIPVGVYSFIKLRNKQYPVEGNGLFVHPDFQKRSIGTQLLETLLLQLKQQGYRQFEVGRVFDPISPREDAQSFWEKQAKRPDIQLKRDAQNRIVSARFDLARTMPTFLETRDLPYLKPVLVPDGVQAKALDLQGAEAGRSEMRFLRDHEAVKAEMIKVVADLKRQLGRLPESAEVARGMQSFAGTKSPVQNFSSWAKRHGVDLGAHGILIGTRKLETQGRTSLHYGGMMFYIPEPLLSRVKAVQAVDHLELVDLQDEKNRIFIQRLPGKPAFKCWYTRPDSMPVESELSYEAGQTMINLHFDPVFCDFIDTVLKIPLYPGVERENAVAAYLKTLADLDPELVSYVVYKEIKFRGSLEVPEFYESLPNRLKIFRDRQVNGRWLLLQDVQNPKNHIGFEWKNGVLTALKTGEVLEVSSTITKRDKEIPRYILSRTKAFQEFDPLVRRPTRTWTVMPNGKRHDEVGLGLGRFSFRVKHPVDVTTLEEGILRQQGQVSSSDRINYPIELKLSQSPRSQTVYIRYYKPETSDDEFTVAGLTWDDGSPAVLKGRYFNLSTIVEMIRRGLLPGVHASMQLLDMMDYVVPRRILNGIRIYRVDPVRHVIVEDIYAHPESFRPWVAPAPRSEMREPVSSPAEFAAKFTEKFSQRDFLMMPPARPIGRDRAPQLLKDAHALASVLKERNWNFRDRPVEDIALYLADKAQLLKPGFSERFRAFAAEQLSKRGPKVQAEDIISIVGFGSYWYESEYRDMDFLAVVKPDNIQEKIQNIAIDPAEWFSSSSGKEVRNFDMLAVSENLLTQRRYKDPRKAFEVVIQDVMIRGQGIVLDGTDYWSAPENA